MSQTTKVFEANELQWSFDGRAQIEANRIKHYVEPVPGYSHNINITRAQLRRMFATCGVPDLGVTYILSIYDDDHRTNGWASEDYGYWDEDDKYQSTPVVYFAGKRTPIHPSVTRYLTTHEYGHHIEYMLNKHFKEEDSREREPFLKDYAKCRGLEFPPNYGPGTWHLHPKEVFANDFRIAWCQSEIDFWPHGCEGPHDYKGGGPIVNYFDHIRHTPKEEWVLPSEFS